MKSERVLRFVLSRKRVTAAVVASQFAIDQSTASKYLKQLHDAGHVTREQFGTHVIWTGIKQPPKEMEPGVMEPEVVEPQTVATFRWPSSYPHVRGYDD